MVNIVYPKSNNDINKEENIDYTQIFNNDQLDNESNTSNESDNSNDPDQMDKHNQNESTPMLEFVTFSEQDITLNQTNDNVVNNIVLKLLIPG